MQARYGRAWHRDRSLERYATRIAEDAITGTGEMLQKLTTSARRYSRNSQSILIALAAKHGD
jgi:hypothetical protein